ncbi:MAG: HAD-IIA family hydrolase [Vicinamibacteria bacterium]
MAAVVCDIDGVVLRDNRPLAGAMEFTRRLVEEQIPFLFLTNFPSQTPEDLRNRFLDAGLDVPAERFYTSAMATSEFLRDQAGDARKVYVIGEGALVHALYDSGFIQSDSDADFVVLGETQSYNFDMIQRAALLIRGGARFIATNPDVAGPFGRPACGALAAPIERITGKAPFYVGKPNAIMMRAALRHMRAHSEEAWMVGDNMETDIIAGIQTGMRTVLVLSGVSQATDLPRYAYRPHHVVSDVSEVLPLIERFAAASS